MYLFDVKMVGLKFFVNKTYNFPFINCSSREMFVLNSFMIASQKFQRSLNDNSHLLNIDMLETVFYSNNLLFTSKNQDHLIHEDNIFDSIQKSMSHHFVLVQKNKVKSFVCLKNE